MPYSRSVSIDNYNFAQEQIKKKQIKNSKRTPIKPFGHEHVVKELRQIKHEIKQHNIDNHKHNGVPQIHPQGSPYLTDRASYDPNRIKGSETERSWKEVPTYEQSRGNSLANYNLKKLNII